MGFGAKLGDILKSKNMTVAELSKQTGISSSTLYAIIRRDSDNVNLSAIQKIAATNSYRRFVTSNKTNKSESSLSKHP